MHLPHTRTDTEENPWRLHMADRRGGSFVFVACSKIWLLVFDHTRADVVHERLRNYVRRVGRAHEQVVELRDKIRAQRADIRFEAAVHFEHAGGHSAGGRSIRAAAGGAAQTGSTALARRTAAEIGLQEDGSWLNWIVEDERKAGRQRRAPTSLGYRLSA